MRHNPAIVVQLVALFNGFLFKPWQVSSIGDDIPGESHCYVFVVDQPIAIVPEIVLGVHAENGINLEILERMGLKILQETFKYLR